MNEIKQWFLNQTPRDQLMLSFCALVLGIYILLFWILKPLQNELDKKQRRNADFLQEQQNVRDLAGQWLARQQNGDAQNSNSLTSMLSETTRQFGLKMENIQPNGHTARVRLAAAPFNQVAAWLHQMEVKQGLQVADITLAADKTPGHVVANLQLSQGE